jgi:kynurenine 3-monooxygenase
MKKITIVGGGLIGSLLSIYLSKRGIQVTIYERRGDPRNSEIENGRSINLALSDRGWKGLESADPEIVESVKRNAIPMRGRIIHSESGQQSLQPYGKEGQYIYSVARGTLNKILIECSEKKYGVEYNFNERCTDVDFTSNSLTFENTNEKIITKVFPEFVFGADGAFSSIRYAMQRTERFNYVQSYLEYGYKELTIPADASGLHQFDKNALHIWPRKSFMLIALPNIDGSFTCTLFLPFEGKNSFQGLNSEALVDSFFNENFHDVFKLIPDLYHQFSANPTSSLVTIQCFPWVINQRYALIGDAAHAIVPFYGQGMNAGFEDCYLLDNMLRNFSGDWTSVLNQFNRERKNDTNAIADLALRNFVEMRDLVIDEKFLLRKKIEARLATLFPNQWIPLYTMVTFSHIPYSKALKLSKIQDKIMEEVLDISGIETSWENIDFEAVIKKYTIAQKGV